jgi:putative transposase
MALFHLNFHTLDSKPIFADEGYDRTIRLCLRDVLRQHKILCLAWEVMPTHVHMMIADFPDLTRGTIVNHIKGGSSHAFFIAHPELRPDLLGGHLWTKGYYFVQIKTHRQFLATLHYIRTNRERADLPPPMPLTAAGRE